MGIEFLFFLKFLTGNDAEFCQMPFQHQMRWPCVFFSLSFVYVVDYIDGFLYIEPSMHHWDEANLIMVNDRFDEFLDSVGKNFT